MNELSVVAGLEKDRYSFEVLILLTESPRRLELAASMMTLVPELATLVVVGVRRGTEVGMGLPASLEISISEPIVTSPSNINSPEAGLMMFPSLSAI
jgi:hypothetical protein